MSKRVTPKPSNINIDEECMEIFGVKEEELNEISRKIRKRQEASTKRRIPPIRPLDVCEQMFLPKGEVELILSKKH